MKLFLATVPNIFPGVPRAGEMFTCLLAEIVLVAAYLVALFWMKHYLNGEMTASRISGRVIGMLCGAGMTLLQTALFRVFFTLDDPAITGCVVIFFLIDAALTTTVVYPAEGKNLGGDANGTIP